jgi:hypothetical protein
MKRHLWIFLFLALAMPLAANVTTPATDTSKTVSPFQQAMVFFSDGREELVFSPTFHAEENSLPSTLGAVIPVPSTPEVRKGVDEELFTVLWNWSERAQAAGKEDASAGISTEDLEKRMIVGPAGAFKAQVIAGGESSLEELEAWFGVHTFAKLPTEALQFYADRHWTFVAVKYTIDPSDLPSTDLRMPPIRLSFDADRMIYPLKIATTQGAFDLLLYTFTERNLVDAHGWQQFSKAYGLQVQKRFRLGSPFSHPSLIENARADMELEDPVNFRQYSPDTFAKLLGTIETERKFNIPVDAWLTRIVIPGINASVHPGEWKNDLFLPVE